ncbi:hypothetical protein Ahy_A05g021872 isoform A [Arachis hypogaea]|uniref:Uncharacterized protein n=1 Tax=Arachis hypogaea TaxID=3818 RepID=A0A445CYS5_ARAHY|nr:hypothetical protein Ahy_A05g021872 isoform A [Arachis hypogaea]
MHLKMNHIKAPQSTLADRVRTSFKIFLFMVFKEHDNISVIQLPNSELYCRGKVGDPPKQASSIPILQ